MSNGIKPSDSSSVRAHRVLLAAALVGTALLASVLPGPAAVLRALLTPTAAGAIGAGAGAGLSVIDAAGLLAASITVWGALTWAGVLLLLAGAARLPGAAGHWSTAVLRRVAPAVVRRALIAGVGVSIAGGVALTGSPALAGAAPAISASAPTTTASTSTAAVQFASTAGAAPTTGGDSPATTAGQPAPTPGSPSPGSPSPGSVRTGSDPLTDGVDWPVQRPTGIVSTTPAPTTPAGSVPVTTAASDAPGQIELDWPTAAGRNAEQPTAPHPPLSGAASTQQVTQQTPPATPQPQPQQHPQPTRQTDPPRSTPASPTSATASAPSQRRGTAAASTEQPNSPAPTTPDAPPPAHRTAPADQHSAARQAAAKDTAAPKDTDAAGRPAGQGPSSGSRPAERIASGVIVRPGDSLWSIAERVLGADGSSDPAAVDACWREWYRANRALIGADPDLILPGQHLKPPAGWPTPQSLPPHR